MKSVGAYELCLNLVAVLDAMKLGCLSLNNTRQHIGFEDQVELFERSFSKPRQKLL